MNMDNAFMHYLSAFENPTSQEPTIKESLMAIAYSIGRRSKCKKRRVGAIVVDENCNIISSGFNGVPNGLTDCHTEHGECYRDTYQRGLRETISRQITNTAQSRALDVEMANKISRNIVDRIKVLELCRALHAEESSIINLVGRSQKQSSNSKDASWGSYTLYATTYPCNLCANRIVQSGIKKVVYYEPYPIEESKVIFKCGNVSAEPFEGVTFRAFFSAFNYEP